MSDDLEVRLLIDDHDNVYVVTEAVGLHRQRCIGHLSDDGILEAVPPDLFEELLEAVDAYRDGYDPSEEARYAYDHSRGRP